MRHIRRLLCTFALFTVLLGSSSARAEDWLPPTSTNRPWTRWWWHGSAVDEANLTRELEAFHTAGLGGVEITPIYGVQGEEAREVSYLSPRWIELANHAIAEVKRLGMQVDLPPGTGWRMGGPWVKPEDGNAQFELNIEDVHGGSTYTHQFGESLPEIVVANGPEGQVVDLTQQIDSDGNLKWTAPEGEWTVSALQSKLIGEKVKRPAPGGGGLNINPYAHRATANFLAELAKRANGLDVSGIRAAFHDSFEYEGNWSDDFIFRRRRLPPGVERTPFGLERVLPGLAGKGEPEYVARVKSYFRGHISDRVLNSLIEQWVSWSHEQGMLARNQAHGSPGNWLDLYAACDIPETESFGRISADPLRHYFFKFASSAAHVAGRSLASSETATWLDEHFNVTLQQIKWIVDLEFLSGINHVIFHGTAYSPEGVDWPGWVFYASTQLNPRNPIWRDAPALFEYITRCQSLLQAGKPDNDVLVYWPIYDIWHDPNGLNMKLTVHNGRQWFGESSLYAAVRAMDEGGATYDFVSDAQLKQSVSEMGRVRTAGANYTAVLIPKCRFMPLNTLKSILRLAEQGAIVGFVGLPQGPPGLLGPQQQEEFDALKASINFQPDDSGRQVAKVGSGEVVLVEDPAKFAYYAECRVESWAHANHFSFIRRKLDVDVIYFIRNDGEASRDVWIAPATSSGAAVLMDPWTGTCGLAARNDRAEYRLQLEPQQTIFLKTVPAPVERPAWQYRGSVESTVAINGPWHVEFIAGGPTLPAALTTDNLESWTTFAGPAGENFAGTARYVTKLKVPAHPHPVQLNLGKVADSARVFLDGQELGVLLGPDYTITLTGATPGEHELAIEVTNVAANRIRDLDRREVKWRIFKDINFVNIDYRPFDASNWPLRQAGLLGPVTLQLLNLTN